MNPISESIPSPQEWRTEVRERRQQMLRATIRNIRQQLDNRMSAREPVIIRVACARHEHEELKFPAREIALEAVKSFEDKGWQVKHTAGPSTWINAEFSAAQSDGVKTPEVVVCAIRRWRVFRPICKYLLDRRKP